jgi:hypothetical protein
MSMRARVVAAVALLISLTAPSLAQPAAPAPPATQPVPPATQPAPPAPPATQPAPSAAPATQPAPSAAPATQPAPPAPPAPQLAALAAPAPPAPAPAPLAQPRPQQQPEGRRLSENTAVMLSLGGALASWAVLRAGVGSDSGAGVLLGGVALVLGPNAGHWYAGTAATRGTGFRLLSVAGMGYGLMRILACEDGCDSDNGGYVFLGGAALYLVATIDDIITAPAHVRARNRRLDAVGVVPMVSDRGAGLGLAGRF